MKRIQQRFRSDCFATCIAMLTGISHSDACRLVAPDRKKGQSYRPFFWRGTAGDRRRFMRRISETLGITVKQVSIKTSLIDLKHNAQISIRWTDRKSEPRAHSVVWDAANKRIICSHLKKTRDLSFYEEHKVGVWEFAR
jgi:hypothetical protein